MNTSTIKSTLHEQIESGDEKLLRMIYALVKEYNEEIGSAEPDLIRKQRIREERERYLKGEGRSFSWEEVKSIAKNKQRPDAL